MGLDWIPGNRPRAEHQDEYWHLWDRAEAAGSSPDRALVERMNAISTPRWVTVGAPRVGFDERATAWFLARLRASRQAPPDGPITAEEQRALDAQRGYYVIGLAPPCDGIPTYTNAPLNNQLERTDFRGEFLKDAERVIGPRLLADAYRRKKPGSFVMYGEALLDSARAFAEPRGLAALEHTREPPDDEDADATAVHIAFAAGKWCVWWGTRGHWLDVWF